MRPIAVALMHYPVLDRSGQEITTAVTNLDVHDIARSAYTFGIERYYIVHPIDAQRQLVQRIRDHWVIGSGRLRIPDRQLPMSCVEIVADLDSALSSWGKAGTEQGTVELWSTSASLDGSALGHAEARTLLNGDGSKVLLLLGTGWGLSPRVHSLCTQRLAPIVSPRRDGYNHLSVRAAAAILFDRLLSNRSAGEQGSEREAAPA